MSTSFNGGQPLTLCSNDGANHFHVSVARTPSGKIVIAGHVSYTDEIDGGFATRLMPDGKIDTSFAGGDVFFDLAPNKFDAPVGMVLQGERIVLGGTRTATQGSGDQDFMLFRLSDGRVFNDGFEGVP